MKQYCNRANAEVSGDEIASQPATRYQVLWAHSQGGLGEVFVAEDTELHRRVALKEIQSKHANDPDSRERFITEAEITGNLEHPGIVPVYGLGTYEDGRPFYTMRFIKGEDLATAIHRFHSKGTANFAGREFRWLLGKLIEVCNTVAYAHSRGVLHRDLKPANIMIGPFGETLVMDWGVAKLINGADDASTAPSDMWSDPSSLTLRTPQRRGPATVTGQVVGTPTFMSPEQAAGRNDAVGPASDVYSLGATLYAILTGRPAFHGRLSDVLQMVQVGQFRSPRQAHASVPKALNAICLRAMETDPSMRYQSAFELAGDIECWLADEPVSAWPDSWQNRGRRWIKRNQALVAGCAAAVGVALVILGVAVPLLSLAWQNERSARQAEQRQRIVAISKASEADASRVKENEEKSRAESTLRFLVEAFRRPDPSMDGRALKVVDLLERAVKDLDQSFGNQPLVRATLLNAIGQTYTGLGLHQDSFSVFDRALKLRRENLGENDLLTLASMNDLAMAYHDAGRIDEAIPILTETLQRRRAALGGEHPDTIETMNDLAVAHWQAGQPERAIPLYESALMKMRAALGDESTDTLTILDNLAVAYAAAGRHDKAIALHEEAIARFRSTLGVDHLSTLVAINNLARAHQSAGHVRDSIELYEEIVPKFRAKLNDDHPTTLAAMSGLGRSYRLAGDLDRAVSFLEAATAGRRAKLGRDHPETLVTTLDLADTYLAAGRREDAIPLARAYLSTTAKLGKRLPSKIHNLIPRAVKLLQEASGAPAKP